MNDVFDEELIKELGLDPEELHGPGAERKKRGEKPAAETAAPGGKRPAPPSAKEPSAAGEEKEPEKTVKAPKKPESLEEESARLCQEIPVHLAAVVAKKTVKLGEVLKLKAGEVLEFKKRPGDPIDLVANGKLIAKAELVMVDGKLGARISKLIK